MNREPVSSIIRTPATIAAYHAKLAAEAERREYRDRRRKRNNRAKASRRVNRSRR